MTRSEKVEKQLLAAVQRYWRVKGHSPTYRELAKAIGMPTSMSHVHRVLQRLADEGHVKLHAKIHRGIMLVGSKKGE